MTLQLSNRIWGFLKEASRTRRERATVREEGSLRAGLRRGFKEQEQDLLSRFDSEQPDRDQPLPIIDLVLAWERVTEASSGSMIEAAQLAAQTAFLKGAKDLGADMAINLAFDLDNPRAAKFLEQRGASLISNIDNTTRADVQRILVNANREGQNYGQVRQQLRGKFSQFHTPQPQQHIRDRAELIAVQEAGEAYEAGNLEAAEELRDLGVELEKSCLTAEDARVDELCNGNENQGWIPLGQAYQSGAQRPPFHVACRCSQLVRRMRE